MNISELYQFVLLLVMVAMITGVSLVVLANFGTATGVVGTSAQTAINSSITAMAAIPNTWLSLIVTISILGLILGIVINSFANRR